jgi:site-specific DNA-adenine methylase
MLAAEKGYLGAKNGSGVYQTIINLMPPHETYIEGFLGTGAIMRRKAPALENIAIESNRKVLDKFTAGQSDLSIDYYCCNAIEFLQSYQAKNKTLIYLDPPYMPETRTSNAKYEHELTVSDHVRLLQVIKQIAIDKNIMIILSGYRSELYNSSLDHWWSHDFQAMTRGGVRTETVWCNFEPGEQHYHTYAGKDFTDRQRIKRKADRWAKKYEAMPKPERQAVLNALLAIDR